MNADERYMQAMKKLLESMPLSKITTQMIEEESGLSRATFYRHYSDKYDLMNAYYANFLDNLVSADQKELPLNELLARILHFFEENRGYFVNMIKYDGQNSFSDYHIKRLYIYVEQKIQQTKGAKPSDAEYTAIDIMCAGSGYCMKKWILQGMTPRSEAFALQMVACVPDNLKKYFINNLQRYRYV